MPARRVEFASLFSRAFAEIDDLYRSFCDDGVLVVALSEAAELDAYVHVGVDVEPSYLVIGRHGRCDLVLAGDPAVSLRHAVLGARREGLGDLRLRLWDLRSGTGTYAESGDRCESLTIEGPLFFRIGARAVFCLPTGALAPLPWAGNAKEVWSSLPERVVCDLRRPRRLARPQAHPAIDASLLTGAVPVPPILHMRPRGGSTAMRAAGYLRVCAGGERIDLAIDAAELERGLLIGRYDRCAVWAALDSLSRLHLLVARDAGATWAIDLASTNGTALGGIPVRQARLDASTELVLAAGVSILWQAPADQAGAARYTRDGGRS